MRRSRGSRLKTFSSALSGRPNGVRCIMTIREIAADSWRDELDSFSRQHEGWIVSVNTRAPDGQVTVQAHETPLQGVSSASPQSNDIAIIVGTARGHLTHE